MWEHRNGILHQHDNEVTRTSTHRLHAKVLDAYQILRMIALPAADCHLIHLPLRTLKKKTYRLPQDMASTSKGNLTSQTSYGVGTPIQH
jgi:hypothetical protein